MEDSRIDATEQVLNKGKELLLSTVMNTKREWTNLSTWILLSKKIVVKQEKCSENGIS